jgi:hypothetical protein
VKLKQEIETLSAKRDRNEDIYVETRLCEGEINTLFDDLPEINEKIEKLSDWLQKLVTRNDNEGRSEASDE